MIFMNLDAWNALGDDERALIEAEAIKLEVDSIARFNDLAAAELKALRDAGMQVTSFAPEDADRLEALWEEGVWQVAIEKSGADAEGLRDIAREAGLMQ